MHSEIPKLLGLLAVMLGSAKFCGSLARWIGQAAVLGELLAGVILGPSILGIVDPSNELLSALSEMGVVILLFEIGLETDLRKLLKVGGASAAVATAGVVLPFALGVGICEVLGLGNLIAIVTGATLTATSVGITARVLADLNHLQETEGQIILGAAVIDDVIGLVILSIVAGMIEGEPVTFIGVSKITIMAFGFLAGTLLIGWVALPPLVRWICRADVPGLPTTLALVVAFGLAWLATAAGSAMLLGAFAAGLLLRETRQRQNMERGVSSIGHFFVPLFFVAVGAAVDVRVLNPADAANWRTLLIAALLIAAAISGKFAAGYAAFWSQADKRVVGTGMIPRGEVGLIFAQMGLSSHVLNAELFSALTLMVMTTTFVAPPMLKYLLPRLPRDAKKHKPKGLEELVSEP